MTNQPNNEARAIRRVAIATIIGNALLFVLKLIIGLVFANFAVFSDAIHSVVDVLTSVTVIIFSYFISDKADEKHNYGHERLEPVFTIILSFVVLGVSGYLAYEGVEGLISPTTPSPNDYWYLIVTVVVSLLIKEGLFFFGIYYAKKNKSEMLRVTAWHNRADSLSSVAVLIGLVCSLFIGTNLMENIAVLFVAALIIKVAIEIFIEAVRQLIDRAAAPAVVAKITELVTATTGVVNLQSLKTRRFGNRLNVDVEIAVDPKLTVVAADKIAQAVYATLMAAGLEIKNCLVCARPVV